MNRNAVHPEPLGITLAEQGEPIGTDTKPEETKGKELVVAEGSVTGPQASQSSADLVIVEEDGEGSVKDPYFRFRLAKQAVLVGCWVAMGLLAEIVGPTLPDLRARLGVNNEQISQGLTGKSIGVMLGAVIGGFAHDRFPKFTDLIIAGCFIFSAVCLALIPWMPQLWAVALMLCVNGLTEGVINIGGNILVMHLWGENTASPMMSLHFGFGLGAVLAPQIARGFLAPDPTNQTMMADIGSLIDPDQSRIEIPYFIIGIATALFCLLLVYFHVKGYPEGFPERQRTAKLTTMVSPGSCAGGNIAMGLSLLAALFFYFIQAVGGERTMGRFIFTFATESGLRMPRGEATTLNSVFWITFASGRGLGVLMARFIPLRGMIILDIAGLLCCSIALAIGAEQNRIILWVFTSLIGFFIAQMFPNGMTWANHYLNMNGMGVMVLLIGAGCGGFIYQYLTGYLTENYGLQSMMYVIFGYAVVILIVYIVMEVLGKLFGSMSVVLQDDSDEVKLDDETNEPNKAIHM